MYRYIVISLALISLVLLAACSRTDTRAPGIAPTAANTSRPQLASSPTSVAPEARDTVSSPKSLPTGAAKSSNAGNVQIDIRLDEVKDNSVVFKVTMNTHSVDLDKFDLFLLSQMRDDKGSQSSPLGWQSPPGGHHRSGDLIFPLPPSVSKGEAGYIELVIKDVAAAQRVFKWELK